MLAILVILANYLGQQFYIYETAAFKPVAIFVTATLVHVVIVRTRLEPFLAEHLKQSLHNETTQNRLLGLVTQWSQSLRIALAAGGITAFFMMEHTMHPQILNSNWAIIIAVASATSTVTKWNMVTHPLFIALNQGLYSLTPRTTDNPDANKKSKAKKPRKPRN